jgi:hypothetical protein
VASSDISSGSLRCVPMKDLELAAKLAYYTGKTLQILESLPPPF